MLQIIFLSKLISVTQSELCTYFDKLELFFFVFSQYWKVTFPLCSTLALFAIPQPMAFGLQTRRHCRANWRIKFFYKRKKIKENSSLSNQVHNSPTGSYAQRFPPSHKTKMIFSYFLLHSFYINLCIAGYIPNLYLTP